MIECICLTPYDRTSLTSKLSQSKQGSTKQTRAKQTQARHKKHDTRLANPYTLSPFGIETPKRQSGHLQHKWWLKQSSRSHALRQTRQRGWAPPQNQSTCRDPASVSDAVLERVRERDHGGRKGRMGMGELELPLPAHNPHAPSVAR